MSVIPTLRDALRYYLINSGAIAFEKFDGTIALSTLDADSAIATIDDSYLMLDGSGNALVNYSLMSCDKLITRLDLKYQKINPVTGSYGAVKFCDRSETTALETPSNFTLGTIGGFSSAACSDMLQEAYERIGEDRPMVFEADGIRDADTAERLARLIIALRTRPLVKIKCSCTYKAISLEIGDKVAQSFTALSGATSCGKLLSSMIFMVTGVNISPNVAGQDSECKIELTELGTVSSIPVVTEWQDTYSTGTEKVDTFNTGETTEDNF